MGIRFYAGTGLIRVSVPASVGIFGAMIWGMFALFYLLMWIAVLMCIWAVQILIALGDTAWKWHLKREAAKDALRARADYEHWLLTQGDERGIYGQYPPAA